MQPDRYALQNKSSENFFVSVQSFEKGKTNEELLLFAVYYQRKKNQ